MRVIFVALCVAILCCGCKTAKTSIYPLQGDDFVIAFGSCNKQDEENVLWDDVLLNKPGHLCRVFQNIYQLAHVDGVKSVIACT